MVPSYSTGEGEERSVVSLGSDEGRMVRQAEGRLTNGRGCRMVGVAEWSGFCLCATGWGASGITFCSNLQFLFKNATKQLSVKVRP